jgi:type IV pilus assembly protein PilO
MALLPTEPRKQVMLFISIISIAVAALFYQFVYVPKQIEIAALRDHVEALDATNHKVQAELSRGSVNELLAQAKMYAGNLELMRRLVPTGNEVPALLEQVSTAARRVDLDLSSVVPEPVVAGDEFDTYRYRMTVNGSYHALAEFLTNVGSLPRIIAPVNVKLAPSTNQAAVAKARKQKGEAVITSDFEIQTYVAKAGDATKPRNGAK